MKYHIDRNSKESAYMQLYRDLRKDIVSGELPYGSKLPSKRFMAEELGISVITVEHAYALLQDEGYIESRPKSGFYVDFSGTGFEVGREVLAPQRGAAVLAKPAPTASLTEAPEDFPFSVFAKTMRKVLSDYDRQILVKAPGTGCTELKKALSGYLLRRRGLRIEAEKIVIGSGAEYLYGLIVQLLGRGSTIALEDPSYDTIRKVYEANGAKCKFLKLGSEGILSSELYACEANAMHVTPFNSYPSGISASASKRHEYAAWAKGRGGYIVEDDYDSEFASPTKEVDTIFSLAPERTIYVNTFSKTLASSMRMGYMVLPEKLFSSYEARLNFYSCTVPVFEQYVLAEFIEEGHLERYIDRRRRKLRNHKNATSET